MPKLKHYRFLELIPGTLTWLTFIFAIVFSFIRPLWVIYFIIVFDLYWVFRVSYFIFYLTLAWNRYRKNIKIDWLTELQTKRNWGNIYHLIFLPTYKEGIGVIRSTFEALVQSKYPPEKLMVVLAGEERDRENFLEIAGKIRKEFGDKFYKLFVTVHPKNLPEEIPGKGSNLNWAGHEVKKEIDRLKIPYEDIIVSSFDVDTCVHPQYFAYLTLAFLNHPDRQHTSYQPIAFYNNNIWNSSALVRVASMATTFWIMTELARPERLFTFSSHSMPWQMLVDVGFWQKDIVTEDSRIFLQGLLRYDGDYTVTPMYIPVSMDTVMVSSWWRSLINLYKQQRRWAWGVEHFPYMLDKFRGNKKIPFRKKLYYAWNLGEGMYSWATVPILIFILGRLPLWVAKGAPEVIVSNAPFALEWLMQLAMAGIFVSVIVCLLIMPPPPQGTKKYRYLIMVLQWLLLPLSLIFFGSIPAVESQTRLMIGKYLGFWVTEKERRADS